MKKLLFLILLIPVFLFSCDNTCPDDQWFVLGDVTNAGCWDSSAPDPGTCLNSSTPEFYVVSSIDCPNDSYPNPRAEQHGHCEQCEDPDENLTTDDNETILFWAVGSNPDTGYACVEPSQDESQSCSAAGGYFGSARYKCCVSYACIVPVDTNDTNGTEPPQDCPNGQDINGHCCSPGETVCQGYCQLNNVPCSDEPDGNGTDPNGGGGGADTNSTDPCDYPLRDSDLPYKGHSFDQDECFNDAKLFSDVNCEGNPVNASFLKDDACAWGACYYLNWTHAPDCNNSGGGGNDNNNSGGGSGDDNNSSGAGDSNTSNDNNASGGLDLTDTNKKLDQLHKDNIDQTNKLTDKLSELDGSAKDIKKQVKDTGDQLAAVLNALNMSQGDKLNNINDTLKDKLDALNQSIQDKNLSVSVNVENNFSIDLNTTNSLLGDIKSDLNSSLFFNAESWNNSMLSFENAYNNAKTIFDDAMTTFSQTLSDIRNIADGESPTFSYSGSCSLDFTLSFGSSSIDISSLSSLRPYFAFFLNMVLLFSVIKFYSWIGQYLIRLLVEAI